MTSADIHTYFELYNSSENNGVKFPALKGSPKQVAWANDIRDKIFDQYREFRSDYNIKKYTLTKQEKELYLIAILKAMRAFTKEKKASFWIDHFDLRYIITK